MRIHHLNCGTLSPLGGQRVIMGKGGWLAPARMICHCVLVEGAEGLLLLDTGFGVQDVADPRGHVGQEFLFFGGPRLDPEEPALRQVVRLGYRPEDVRHVVLTHLDLDHAGGLPDFPRAQVHVLDRELDAAMARRTLVHARRYHPVLWSHGPRWVRHSAGGERWFGLETAGRIEGFSVEVVLLPLLGHSPGHCGVAVRAGQGWLLHAGDAYNSDRELAPRDHRPSLGMACFQAWIESDRTARLSNQERLRALVRERREEVRIFCAHDPDELEKIRGAVP
ncbi:MAG: MBL fold metallo-hydrolase [Planctomycetes bacterium]|nr:MBL fold metallo-hydrolase [Planctomycetota bacterium]